MSIAIHESLPTDRERHHQPVRQEGVDDDGYETRGVHNHQSIGTEFLLTFHPFLLKINN